MLNQQKEEAVFFNDTKLEVEQIKKKSRGKVN